MILENKKILAAGGALLILGLTGGFLFAHWFASTPPQFHRSYFSQPDIFDAGFLKAQRTDIPKIENPKGAIVNHHLLAADFIGRVFLSLQSQNPEVVVLISPNHFGAGHSAVLTSEWNWQTPYGTLKPDIALIKNLAAKNIVRVEEFPFEKEHGISGIVPFIKKTFPKTKIVPLILKEHLPVKRAEQLARQLSENLPSAALVVLSMDFSHYKTSAQADREDEKSMHVIQNFDFSKIGGLDIDSRAGLQVLLRYIKLKNADIFTLFDHSNSTKIMEKEGPEGTTSYVTGIFSDLPVIR